MVTTEPIADNDGRIVLEDGTVVINKRFRNREVLQSTGNKIEYIMEKDHVDNTVVE
jgi:hypothetical protein